MDKKLQKSTRLWNRTEFLNKHLAGLFTAIILLSSLTGCAGLILDAVKKSGATGETYSEIKKALSSPTKGNGRLYIYRTEDSTSTSLQYGIGLQKNTTYCTVDDMAYELIWEVFKYIDLSEGSHEITCGSDVLKKVDFWSGRGHFQKGKNKMTVIISSVSEVFVRVDGVEEDPYFQPVLINALQGKKEILNVSYQKGTFNIPDGKISQ